MKFGARASEKCRNVQDSNFKCSRFLIYRSFLVLSRNSFSSCTYSLMFGQNLLLPSATVVAERFCFHRCLSVHRVGEVYTLLWAETPRPRHTATAADGTHPTGMHSCLPIFLQKTAWKWKKLDREWGHTSLAPPWICQLYTCYVLIQIRKKMYFFDWIYAFKI